jgi:hypothetical protein
MKDLIYEGGPIILYYLLLFKIAYSIQHSKILYRFVA